MVKRFAKKAAAAVLDVFALSVQILLYFTYPFFMKREVPQNSIERPVILVHGYLHNASVWMYMMPRLRKAGFKRIYALNLPLFGSIETSAKLLEKKAEEIFRETRSSEVAFLGHSMGGLVAARAALNMQEKKTPVQASHVAALGSPFDGARAIVKYLGFGKNAREMEAGSEFLSQLQKDLLRAEFPILQVGGEPDCLVSCRSALRPCSKKRREILLDDRGHAFLPFSSSIANAAIDFFTESMPLRLES